MVRINQVEVPTCAELAKILKTYGDVPLFSGIGWYAVNGFFPCEDGVQVSAIQCPPKGVMSKERRNGGR